MFFKAEDVLRKAKSKKNGNHPTILSRWKAQESYRTSAAKHNIGEKEIMLYDQIALGNHDYIATKAERMQNSKHCVLSINAEGPQLPRQQRPDYARSKKRMPATTRRVFLAGTKQDSSTNQFIRANKWRQNQEKERERAAIQRKEVKNMTKRERESACVVDRDNRMEMVQRAAETKPAAYFVFVCPHHGRILIHAKIGMLQQKENGDEWHSTNQFKQTNAWRIGQWVTSLLLGQQDGNGTCRILRFVDHALMKTGIHGTDNEWRRGVYTEYTPVACITSTTVFSQAQITCVLVAQELNGSRLAASSLCAWKQFSHLVRHVISLLVSSTSSHFQSTTTRSTTWTARTSPRRHCTPSTSSRTKAVDKQRYRTALSRQLREWPKPAQHLSHRLWAQRACDNFWKFSGRHLSIIRCTERTWRTRSTSSNHGRSEGIWTNWDTKLTRSRDSGDVTCWEDVLASVPDALRRVSVKLCWFWSRRWGVTKDADFTTVCPKSFWETRCNGRSGERDRGKCTNVSFIRRS